MQPKHYDSGGGRTRNLQLRRLVHYPIVLQSRLLKKQEKLEKKGTYLTRASDGI